VVIDDLDVESIAVQPPEADALLLVNANTVLPRTVAFERLELIRWRDHQIPQVHSAIKVFELLARTLLNLIFPGSSRTFRRISSQHLFS